MSTPAAPSSQSTEAIIAELRAEWACHEHSPMVILVVSLLEHGRAREEELHRQLILLARLAHPEPQFFSPLEVMAARDLRDRILEEAGLV